MTKLNPTGSKVLYSTYLGGGLRAIGTGIAVDRAGAAYVVGLTDANQDPGTRQFPVTAHKRQCQAGTDGFVVVVNPEAASWSMPPVSGPPVPPASPPSPSIGPAISM